MMKNTFISMSSKCRNKEIGVVDVGHLYNIRVPPAYIQRNNILHYNIVGSL